MVDLTVAASNIAAALNSLNPAAFTITSPKESAKNAVDIYMMVLTEMMDRDRAGTLYEKL